MDTVFICQDCMGNFFAQEIEVFTIANWIRRPCDICNLREGKHCVNTLHIDKLVDEFEKDFAFLIGDVGPPLGIITNPVTPKKGD